MTYFELAARPPLDSIVRCFWFLRATQAQIGTEPQVVVADGRVEIILHLGDPFARLGVRQASALLCGQLTAPIQLAATGWTDIVGIRFRTAAAATLVRTPLAEVTDRIVSLRDVSRRLEDDLLAAAARSDQPEQRAAALADVLTRAVARPHDLLATAVVQSLDTQHAPPVRRVAAASGVSARTLERRVLAATGLSPGLLRRVMRFRRAFRAMDQAAPGTWARVAAANGYFDQAHLIRDFQQFAGAPPSRFFVAQPDLARSIMGSDPTGLEP